MIGKITAAGIDISDKRISLVLLRKGLKSIEFVRSAEMPVPAGAIVNGNIANADALAKAVKQLKRKAGARATQTVISLYGKTSLLQIMEMPKGMPANMRQFINNEIKQCAILPGKKINFDYCGLNEGKKNADARLLVAATDAGNMTEVARNYNKSFLNVDIVEPPILACTRALYPKKVADRFGANILFVLLHNDSITLWVFKNQAIDFIRTKTIEPQKDGTALCDWISKQVNEIIQFYEMEVPDSASKWEISVTADSVEIPANTKELLKEKISCVGLDVRTRQDGLRDMPIISKADTKGASLIAAGFAMRLLEVKTSSLKLNLFPTEASEMKVLRNDFMVAANALAAVILLLVFLTGGLIFVIQKNQATLKKKGLDDQYQQALNTIKKVDVMNHRIEQLSDRPSDLTKLLSLQQEIEWSNFLNDVRACTPKAVRILNLNSFKNRVALEGLAMSYESIHLFVNSLNKSQFVAEASLAGTEKKPETNGLIKYSINCVIAQKEKPKNGTP